MAKKLKIPTRSIGVERVETPVAALAEWASERRGRGGDRMTFQIEKSLAGQGSVDLPCAGGAFYRERWVRSIAGIEEDALIAEPVTGPGDVQNDASCILALRKNAWVAVPSCNNLGIADRYFRDREEFLSALGEAYADLARSMRDAGIAGHVYLGEAFPATVLDELAGAKALFVDTAADRRSLASLLEYQDRIAIGTRHLPILEWLLGMYHIEELIILDPTPESLAQAAEQIGASHLVAGGYCRADCSAYWKDLADSAFLLR